MSKEVTRPGAEKFPKISYQLMDSDGDLATTGDQWVNGPGYRAAMPYTFAETYYYKNIFPWRSIFDEDATTITTTHRQCGGSQQSLPPTLELFLPSPSDGPKPVKLPELTPPKVGK